MLLQKPRRHLRRGCPGDRPATAGASRRLSLEKTSHLFPTARLQAVLVIASKVTVPAAAAAAAAA